MIVLLSDGSFRDDWGAYTVDQHWNLATVGSRALQVAIDGDTIFSGIGQ